MTKGKIDVKQGDETRNACEYNLYKKENLV